MSKSLLEYADWLAEREDLRWPQPPKVVPAQATPYLKPLADLRAVLWNVYGTLLRISEGELLFQHPQPIRMEVALDKTIQEFNMWASMTRHPGAPWQYLQEKYLNLVDEQRLAGTGYKGEYPEINSAKVWRRVLGLLEEKEYTYDEDFYGDMDELSAKVAYFFHASLQSVEAAPNALSALDAGLQAGLRQGLLAETQPFTLVQLLRALRAQGTLSGLGELLLPEHMTLSHQEGRRKPSKSLYLQALAGLVPLGIEPRQVLLVGTRLRDDLAVAKACGMRTALYAADKTSLRATAEELRDPDLRPDRLITDLIQIRELCP